MKNFAYDHNPILLYFRLKDLVVVLTMDLYEHRSYIIFKCVSQLLKFFSILKLIFSKKTTVPGFWNLYLQFSSFFFSYFFKYKLRGKLCIFTFHCIFFRKTSYSVMQPKEERKKKILCTVCFVAHHLKVAYELQKYLK